MRQRIIPESKMKLWERVRMMMPGLLAGLAFTSLLLGPQLQSKSGGPVAMPLVLNTTVGQEVGSVYEAYLSPHQEPDEEQNTPEMTPKQFKSTAPSKDREQRVSKGHGVIRFSKDLSRAWVDVKVENVNAADVNMFHIHCGKPDMLGPILVDFAQARELSQELADGVLSIEVSNELIAKTSHTGHGLVGAMTVGCPVDPDQPMFGKVKTVAGMEHIARKSELYFNLHTKGQTFYGEMRGQVHPVAK